MSHVALGAVLGVATSVFLIAFQVLIWRRTRIAAICGYWLCLLLSAASVISMLPLVT